MIYPQRGASYGEKNSQCQGNLGRYQSGNGLFRLDGEVSALAKSLQSLLKKVTDAGLVKDSELHEQRISLQRKAGDPADHKEYLEPMEARSTVS